MKKLDELTKYGLVRSISHDQKEAEERMLDELEDKQIRLIIQNELRRCGGDEYKLPIKWLMLWRLLEGMDLD